MKYKDKVDGKTLCLLCSLSCKRILHKASEGDKQSGEQDQYKKERKSKHAKISKNESNHDSPKDEKPSSVAAAALGRIGTTKAALSSLDFTVAWPLMLSMKRLHWNPISLNLQNLKNR